MSSEFRAGPFLLYVTLSCSCSGSGAGDTSDGVDDVGAGNDGTSPQETDTTFALVPLQLWGKRGGPGNLPGLGGPGNDDDSFTDPTGIALSRDELEVYVIDAGNDRIKVCSPEGTTLRIFAHHGGTNDIAVGIDGTLYTWEAQDRRVVRYDRFGTVLQKWSLSGEDSEASGISFAVDANGMVYVGDGGVGRISVFTAEGALFREFGERGEMKGQFPNGPNGIALCSGFMVGSSFGDLLVFGPFGNFVRKVPGPASEPARTHEGGMVSWQGRCVSLLWDVMPGGYAFYVLDRESNKVTDVATFVQGRNRGELELPSHFAIDSTGRWYVTERNNHRVQIFQGPFHLE